MPQAYRRLIRLLVFAGTTAVTFLCAGLGALLAIALPDWQGSVDAVFIAGGDAGWRAPTGFALYRSRRARNIVFMGKAPGLIPTTPPYTPWDTSSILAAGVSPGDYFFDTTARNTRQEAAAVRALARENGWRSVVIVSDPPHTRRLRRVYGRYLLSTGIEWHLVAAPYPRWRTEKWWTDPYALEYGVREAAKNLLDILYSVFGTS